jgi:hypothetical protein
VDTGRLTVAGRHKRLYRTHEQGCSGFWNRRIQHTAESANRLEQHITLLFNSLIFSLKNGRKTTAMKKE